MATLALLVWVVSIAVFALVLLIPGDPTSTLLGDNATPAGRGPAGRAPGWTTGPRPLLTGCPARCTATKHLRCRPATR
ncbi:hypothetical protein HBB16_00885 [Pseudonocardia sp. MCCB 268]|nr:hypothetical protein [Pseudonocardia cytotoxica]